MDDTLDRYTRISRGFTDRVRAVRPDQWAAQTPCEDWDVTALVSHLVGTHHMMLSMIGQAHEAPAEGDDLVAAWEDARQAVLDALTDPETAGQTVQSPFGETTFAGIIGGLLCGDALYHTWDLARATGQDETLGDDLCATQLEYLQPFDDRIRMPGFFADKIEPAPDADIQTRLLNFGGRRP